MIPRSHLDLLERPLLASLATRMPDGSPQTQPVWFDFEGGVRINTMRGFRKELNMRADPRVALLVVDPCRPARWIEIRGRVELRSADARAHLDRLAGRYTGAHRYFGECVPRALARCELPVIGLITPTRVVTEDDTEARDLDAIASDDTPCALPAAPIRPDHLDLLEGALPAILSTSLHDGQPQTQPASVTFDGAHVRVCEHSVSELADRRATVLVIDPRDTGRWIEVRGRRELTAQSPSDVPLIYRTHPVRVVYDAIHRSKEKDA